MKLLRSSRTSEARILPYLARFDSPDNHTIRPLGIRRCDEGTLLLLPDAGTTIREHNGLASCLLSVARQFFQGVAFLHEHGVAHCDLKTSNVVIDEKDSLTIIDFDLAVWTASLARMDGLRLRSARYRNTTPCSRTSGRQER